MIPLKPAWLDQTGRPQCNMKAHHPGKGGGAAVKELAWKLDAAGFLRPRPFGEAGLISGVLRYSSGHVMENQDETSKVRMPGVKKQSGQEVRGEQR